MNKLFYYFGLSIKDLTKFRDNYKIAFKCFVTFFVKAFTSYPSVRFV